MVCKGLITCLMALYAYSGSTFFSSIFPLQRSKQIDNRFLTFFLVSFVALCHGTVKGFLISSHFLILKTEFFLEGELLHLLQIFVSATLQFWGELIH